MDCKEFREVLDLFIDQELSADGMSVAEQHLLECNPCGRVERELRRVRVALKDVVNRHEPPAHLVRRIRSQFQPNWRGTLGVSSASLAADSMDDRFQSRSLSLLWRRKLSLPVPIFGALLVLIVVIVVIASWGVFRRPKAPVAGGEVGVRQPTRMSKPATGNQREADLSRFDRGDRAAILKLRTEEVPHDR